MKSLPPPRPSLADRIIDAVARPISIGDRRVDVGASIGIAICPMDGTDPETLLRAADMAMYRAKEEGRGTIASSSGAWRTL